MKERKIKEFLKSSFADDLVSFLRRWNKAIEWLVDHRYMPKDHEDYIAWEFRKHICQAQWIAYSQALKYIFDVEYFLKKEKDYFGIATIDEKDWLFKIERN